MTVLGTVGRWFLIAGACVAVAALVAYALFSGPTAGDVAFVLATVAPTPLIIGTVFTLVQLRTFGSRAALARVAASGCAPPPRSPRSDAAAGRSTPTHHAPDPVDQR